MSFFLSQSPSNTGLSLKASICTFILNCSRFVRLWIEERRSRASCFSLLLLSLSSFALSLVSELTDGLLPSLSPFSLFTVGGEGWVLALFWVGGFCLAFFASGIAEGTADPNKLFKVGAHP
ncbi:hypothetical protein AMTRI_Chr03g145710 [Amborella trichopoda]